MRRSITYKYFVLIFGATASSGPQHTHSRGFKFTHDAPQSVGLLSINDQLVAENKTQHSQQTTIHATGGIRIHTLSMRAAADQRLRPRGHWDRHIETH